MSQDSDSSLLFSDDLSDEELERMLSELVAEDENKNKEHLVLNDDDTTTLIEDSSLETDYLETDRINDSSLNAEFDFGLTVDGIEVDNLKVSQTEADLNRVTPDVAINASINKQQNTIASNTDESEALSTDTIDFDFGLDDEPIPADSANETATNRTELSENTLNDQISEHPNDSARTAPKKELEAKELEAKDLQTADLNVFLEKNKHHSPSNDTLETIYEPSVSEKISNINDDSLDDFANANVLSEDNSSKPTLMNDASSKSASLKNAFLKNVSVVENNIILENETPPVENTSLENVETISTLDNEIDADLPTDFSPESALKPEVVFEPSAAIQSKDSVAARISKIAKPFFEAVIQEVPINTMLKSPLQDTSHLMTQQAHSLSKNNIEISNEVTDIEIDGLGHIKHQTRLLKSYLSDIEAPFLAANQVSSQLTREVRQLQNEQHGQYSETHAQTHELRTRLIDARKQFIELLSIVDLVEENLENEYSEQIHRSD